MRIFRSLFTIASVLYSLFFLLSCFSRFIAPSTFQYISLPALTYPILFAGQVVNCLVAFLVFRRTALFAAFCLLFSYFNLKTIIGFNAKRFSMQQPKSSIRVMTWNVLYFLSRSKDTLNNPRLAMVNVIREYSPDILCFQDYVGYKDDVNGNVQEELKQLGYNYQFLSDSVGTTFSGVALMSKFPLCNSSVLTIDSSTGNKTLIADIALRNDTVTVYSSHLQSYALFADTAGTHSRLGNYKIGFERKRYFIKRIRDVEKVHEQQVKSIKVSMASKKHPVIFCGDINSVPSSYTYSQLAAGMKDAHVEKGYFLGGTYFHLFPTLRIDVCLADKRFDVLQTTIDQRRLSDHKAVITDLVIRR